LVSHLSSFLSAVLSYRSKVPVNVPQLFLCGRANSNFRGKSDWEDLPSSSSSGTPSPNLEGDRHCPQQKLLALWMRAGFKRSTSASRFEANRWTVRLLNAGLWGAAVTLGWGAMSPGWAASQVTVQLGPVQQTVALSDLELFVQTGEIPPALRLYAPLLTSDVRMALGSRLELDPQVGDKLVQDSLNSTAGQRLLQTLQVAIPDSSVEQLETALIQSAEETDGISLIGFFRAFPAETITIDGTSAIALASQLNLPYWQSQALSSILERELTVPTQTPFRSAFDPSKPGEQWVRQQTITFHDYERRRTIPVDLYWSRRTHGPLVILSHGFGADRRFLSYLAFHLASHGITVAALEHPGSNVAWLTELAAGVSPDGRYSEILPANEFIDRPKDISFLLDQLERLNRYSNILRGKFDTDRVTVIGHSLGGYTALALAGAELDLDKLRQFCQSLGPAGLSPSDWVQCTAADIREQGQINLSDRRVVQVMALNPVIGHLFSDKSLAQIDVPVMVVSGTDDAIAPAVSQQFLPFTQISAPKYLLTAIGGTHLSVGDPANLNYALTDNLFVRERPGEQTEPLRHLLRGISLSFIEQLTPNRDRYKQFLTPAYAQSLSTPVLKLRLSRELPPNLSNWLKMAALPLEQFVASSLQKQPQQPNQAGYGLYISNVLGRLPLVMFILPGSLPLVGNQLLQLARRQHKSDDD
jgi:predicted dienelactone hydrolase